jgi:hypothetical protein
MNNALKSYFLHAAILAAILCTGCSRVRPPTENTAVVAAPISGRANIILANLIEECPIVNRQWRHDMDCTAVSAAIFGYEVGHRRNREDILRIGRVAADNESSKMKSFLWQYILRQSPDYSDLNGSPACFYSGLYDHDGLDYWMFSKLTEAIARNPEQYRLNPSQIAGSVYLLSFMTRVEPKDRAYRLGRARYLAAKLAKDNYPTFTAFAYASIARATKDSNDLKMARKFTAGALELYFEPNNPAVKARPNAECLSWYSSLINACADLAELEPQGPWRSRAFALLDYIFSDRYFNGKFLVHHLNADGTQADSFCAGCNFAALYLADRLYGDSLRLNPVKTPQVLHVSLRIIHAEYGASDKFIDVTRQLQKRIRNDRLRLQVTDNIAGDPLPSARKILRLKYTIDKHPFTTAVPEYSWLNLP